MSRFSRQVLLPQIGPEGQEKLRRARVLVVGVGGLGCPAVSYLAAAGVGVLGLIDPDKVELENLHRQLLYDERDIGRPKVDAAAERLASIAPDTCVETFGYAIDASNSTDLIGRFDMVLDGTDRFDARYAVNQGAVESGRLNVFAAVFGFFGQLTVFGGSNGPCYRCAFPSPPEEGSVPNCAEAGVLGALPGLMGTWQAMEALKIILGVGTPLNGRLMLYDGLAAEIRSVSIERSPHCPICAGVLRTTVSTKISNSHARMQAPEVIAIDLAAELRSPKPPILLDVREPEEVAIVTLPNAVHIPLGELLERVGELDPESDLVVYCRSGARSANAASFLLKRGFKQVRNLSQGIIGWIRTVDNTLPEY